MAEFNKIISTLLNDVIQAQHEANLYAGSLRNEYREGGKANGFTLPYATIGNIELNLKYGIENAESQREQVETDYQKLYSFLKNFSHQTAKVTIAGIISSIKAVDVATDGEAQRIWVLLSEESKEYRKLLTYLSRRIYSRLISGIGVVLDGQGSLLTEPLVTLLCSIIRSDFLCLPDIEGLFNRKKSRQSREEVENNAVSMLRPFVEEQVSGYNFSTKRIVPTADVIVDSVGLEKVPAECIHSIRLKLSLPDSSNYVEPHNEKQ